MCVCIYIYIYIGAAALPSEPGGRHLLPRQAHGGINTYYRFY